MIAFSIGSWGKTIGQGISSTIGNIIEWVVSIFTILTTFFNSLWNLIISIIANITKFINIIQSVILDIDGTIVAFPSWLLAFITMSLSVSIVYLIVGRN